jgi:hypothetical protein
MRASCGGAAERAIGRPLHAASPYASGRASSAREDLMSLALTVLAMMAAAATDTAETREERMWKNVQAGNMEVFRAELDDRFIAVYPFGVNDKAGEVAALEKQKLQSFEFKDFLVRPLSGSVELVSYIASVKGTYEEADISGDYRVTSVWKKDGAAWKLAYHSEMRVE